MKILNQNLNRRKMLKGTASASCLFALDPATVFQSLTNNNSFYIGACDWSINQKSDVEAMRVASEIGLDGVQISLGTLENDMHLRRKEIQNAYKQAARENNVQVGGIAIGELNKVPYKSDPRTIPWVRDSIDVANAMDVEVVLLAFFGDGDLKNDTEGTEEVIRRLKQVAPKAEAQGVILGIESWLSAEEHMDIIDRVGSENIKVYYDTANSHKMGYDIYEEIRWLGNQNICEFHAKENGNLLGHGKIDFQKVNEAIQDIGFKGWIQIEGAMPEGKAMLPSYKANVKFLRKVMG